MQQLQQSADIHYLDMSFTNHIHLYFIAQAYILKLIQWDVSVITSLNRK